MARVRKAMAGTAKKPAVKRAAAKPIAKGKTLRRSPLRKAA
jgi:hypothetical protein